MEVLLPYEPKSDGYKSALDRKKMTEGSSNNPIAALVCIHKCENKGEARGHFHKNACWVFMNI